MGLKDDSFMAYTQQKLLHSLCCCTSDIALSKYEPAVFAMQNCGSVKQL